MSWEPGVVHFGDGYYEFPRDTFDPQEYSRIQAEYLLKHTEVTALASLFVAQISRKTLKNVNVLKEAALFFTRPAAVLKQEVKQELKRKGKLGFKPDIMKKHQSTPLPRRPREEQLMCPCPTVCTPSVQSFYSEFVTESTSATTLPSEVEHELATPTLEEAMEQLIVKALDTGLNKMYEARERQIVYDEAYLCLIGALEKAVVAIWKPVIDDIKGFIDKIVDNVRVIATQRHRMKMIMTNKVPTKTNRWINNFKGFIAKEYEPPTRKQVLKTFREKQGTYNRYPKDAFGVYISTCDQSLGESVTREPADALEDVISVASFVDDNDDDDDD